MDSPLFALIGTVVLPGVFVWLAYALALGVISETVSDLLRLAGWILGLIVPAAFLVQKISFPPKEAADWLLWLAIAAALLGLIRNRIHDPILKLGVTLGVLGFELWSQTSAAIQYQWSAGQTVLWLSASALIFGLQIPAWPSLLSALPRRLSWFVPGAYAGLVAACLLVSGSASLAQRAGMVASAAGSLFLWQWLPFGKTGGPAWSALFSLFLGALILQGHLYADLLLGPGVMLALSPLLAWGVGQFFNKKWVTAAVLLGLPAAALVWSVSTSPPTGY